MAFVKTKFYFSNVNDAQDRDKMDNHKNKWKLQGNSPFVSMKLLVTKKHISIFLFKSDNYYI